MGSSHLAFLLIAAGTAASSVAARADETRTSAAPEAIVADLRARIVRSASATAVLEEWCAEHGLAREARLVALRQAGPVKPLTEGQRARLGVGPDEPIRYRRVRLACGTRVLSEADNWYVPSRLTPEMNAALDGSDTPFGRVVRPLAPTRRVVDVHAFPIPAGPAAGDPLLEVDAVLVTGAGVPFCEVVETYLGGALPAGGPPHPSAPEAAPDHGEMR